MIELGKWLLDNACEQLVKWQSKNVKGLPIYLNFSPQQFYHSQFIDMVREALTQSHLAPELLGIEVTEKTLMTNIEASSKIIYQLDRLGVSCIVDDFCGDNLSLIYLKQLPIKTVKVARTLIDKLKYHPQDTAIIAGIIALENYFGLKVLAKGVETQRQLHILRHLQCHQIQGNLYSPPLSASDMTRYLTNFSEETHLLTPIALKNWQRYQNVSVQDTSVTLVQATAS
ncbi:MAG: EAL domain-containing protein [Microcystaceae cyanobacterium]